MIETDISRAILEEYQRNLLDHLENDVVIVGAGPAGLTAAYYLSKAGLKTAIIERKLSTGGGIWGGAAGYNIVVTQDSEIPDEFGMTAKKQKGLFIYDAVEFATALAYKAKKAGTAIFNLMEVEDIILKTDRIEGVVVNNTAIAMGRLHVDPFCIASKIVLDTTGHPSEVVGMLTKRRPEFLPKGIQESFMDVDAGESGVVNKAGEIFPGLYVAGMSVCAVYNLPRMGPIFGGMLKSGQKAAQMIIKRLSKA
jgi:thiazole biosynthesis enzyme